MPREDWQEREEERRRASLRGDDDYGQADYSRDYGYDADRRSGYRAEADDRPATDDFGQADYSKDYVYDPERGRAFRRHSADDQEDARRVDDGGYRAPAPSRSWLERRRRGPSDRVLWAVIVERLEDQHGLDLRDVEVLVEEAEVTLNGRVRHKADRRRIEDVADIDGVRHVQNNLRVRDHPHWTFF